MDNGTGAAVKDRPQTLPCNDSTPTHASSSASSSAAASSSPWPTFVSPPATSQPPSAFGPADAESSPACAPPSASARPPSAFGSPDGQSWLSGWPIPSRPLFALSDGELATELNEVFAAEQQLAARRLALVAEIDARGMAVREGARNTAVWLAGRLRLDAGRARETLRLARALAAPLSATADALSSGRIHVEQAQVIEKAIGHLPEGVGPAIRGQAEHALIGFADSFAPSALGVLGDRILGHVAPQVAEEHERAQLEREQARAWQERCLHIRPHGPARHRVSGWLDNESAATINAALDALCKPPTTCDANHASDANHANDTGGASDTGGTSGASDTGGASGSGGAGGASGSGGAGAGSLGQQRADALVHLCRMAMGGGLLPTQGGARPHVFVMMPFGPWQQATEAALGTLPDGRKVTPEAVRRMACDADLAPFVLGSHGEVLDVGRTRRLVTSAIRKALIVRDGGCAFPGCDRPAGWCDAHHRVHWVDGGVTSVDGCVLLCRKHHVTVHEGQWHIRLGHDRLPEFIPPVFVDPLQQPQRNLYHQRT